MQICESGKDNTRELYYTIVFLLYLADFLCVRLVTQLMDVDPLLHREQCSKPGNVSPLKTQSSAD